MINQTIGVKIVVWVSDFFKPSLSLKLLGTIGTSISFIFNMSPGKVPNWIPLKIVGRLHCSCFHLERVSISRSRNFLFVESCRNRNKNIYLESWQSRNINVESWRNRNIYFESWRNRNRNTYFESWVRTPGGIGIYLLSHDGPTTVSPGIVFAHSQSTLVPNVGK